MPPPPLMINDMLLVASLFRFYDVFYCFYFYWHFM